MNLYGRSIFTAAAVVVCNLFAVVDVRANPTGVPVPEVVNLSCTTANFKIEALVPGGVFPNPTQCAGQPCSDYGYIISSTTSNIEHTVFAVSATQDLYSTSPAAFVSAPGTGDLTTGFLTSAKHEYPVRFSASKSKFIEAHIFIVGASAPRQSTVLMFSSSGKKQGESCVIAGPGSGGKGEFQPVLKSQTVVVAGGKCIATLTYDADGNVVDATTEPPCFAGQPSDGTLIINGEPLRNNDGPHGITFGRGTTTCYGPPMPSVPKCICTKRPCP